MYANLFRVEPFNPVRDRLGGKTTEEVADALDAILGAVMQHGADHLKVLFRQYKPPTPLLVYQYDEWWSLGGLASVATLPHKAVAGTESIMCEAAMTTSPLWSSNAIDAVASWVWSLNSELLQRDEQRAQPTIDANTGQKLDPRALLKRLLVLGVRSGTKQCSSLSNALIEKALADDQMVTASELIEVLESGYGQIADRARIPDVVESDYDRARAREPGSGDLATGRDGLPIAVHPCLMTKKPGTMRYVLTSDPLQLPVAEIDSGGTLEDKLKQLGVDPSGRRCPGLLRADPGSDPVVQMLWNLHVQNVSAGIRAQFPETHIDIENVSQGRVTRESLEKAPLLEFTNMPEVNVVNVQSGSGRTSIEASSRVLAALDIREDSETGAIRISQREGTYLGGFRCAYLTVRTNGAYVSVGKAAYQAEFCLEALPSGVALSRQISLSS